MILCQLFTAVFYYTVGNFPPLIRASLKSIQLIAVVTYPLLKQYGFEAVLKPFIEEMNSYQRFTSHLAMYMYLYYIHETIFSYIYKCAIVNFLHVHMHVSSVV